MPSFFSRLFSCIGEANANKNMDLYNCTFPAMIDDWRKKFRQSSGTSSLFPFGFVQVFLILIDFSLTVKAATLIVISGLFHLLNKGNLLSFPLD